MQIVLAILSVGLLVGIIYIAVSPKSSRLLKLSALVALGFIALSLAVCGFFLIKGPGETEEFVPTVLFENASQPPKKGNTMTILVFLAALLFIIGLIVFVARHEQRKKEMAARTARKPRAVRKDQATDTAANQEEPEDKSDDDSFDLNFN